MEKKLILNNCFVKKTVKILGATLTLLSIAFIIKKLFYLNINYSYFVDARRLFYSIAVCIAFGTHMFILCLPWKGFIEILSGIKVPFYKASWILNKSNLLKYLPGNVLQFVGRNEIAIQLKLKHIDVAFATLCDTCMLLGVNFLLALCFYWQGALSWLQKNGSHLIYFASVVMLAVLCLGVFVFLRWKEQICSFILRLKVFFTPRALFRIAGYLIFYSLITIFVSYLFAFTVEHITGVSLKNADLLKIFGAYSLSWIAGCVVVGAPGGIGVKEATLIFLLQDVVSADAALLSAVIFRFITTIGDFVGVLLSFIAMKILESRTAHQ